MGLFTYVKVIKRLVAKMNDHTEDLESLSADLDDLYERISALEDSLPLSEGGEADEEKADDFDNSKDEDPDEDKDQGEDADEDDELKLLE